MGEIEGSEVFNVPCIITTLITKERQRLVAALSGLYVLQVVRLPAFYANAQTTDYLELYTSVCGFVRNVVH